MRAFFVFFVKIAFLLPVYGQLQGQSDVITDATIYKEMAWRKALVHYQKGRYTDVLFVYDSIFLATNSALDLEVYKVMSDSYLNLASKSGSNSSLYISKSKEAYSRSIRWYGRKFVEDYWDSALELSKNIFDQYDKPAVFTISKQEYSKYLSANLRYPESAKRLGIEGRIYVQFTVNTDGTKDGFRIVKGALGNDCKEEAIRLVKEAPNFMPALKDNKPVYSRWILPVVFSLGERSKH